MKKIVFMILLTFALILCSIRVRATEQCTHSHCDATIVEPSSETKTVKGAASNTVSETFAVLCSTLVECKDDDDKGCQSTATDNKSSSLTIWVTIPGSETKKWTTIASSTLGGTTATTTEKPDLTLKGETTR